MSPEQWQRLSYDVWGKRRYPNGGDDATGVLETTAQTDRGYTGHEHLQEVGLIHMNGRVYDPQIARFMSADPFIQDPMKTQALNRYTYVDNNPLAYTDPSGYFKLKKLFKNPIVRAVVAIAAAAIIGPTVAAWVTTGLSTAGATASAVAAAGGLLSESVIVGIGATAATAGSISGAIAGGFAAGIIAGGNLESGFKGAIGGLIGASVGVVFSAGELGGLDRTLGRMVGGGINGALQSGDARGFLRGYLIGALPDDLGFARAYKNDWWANIGIGVVRGGVSGAIVGGRDGILRGIALSQVNNVVGHLVGLVSTAAAPRFEEGTFIYRSNGWDNYGAITFGNAIVGGSNFLANPLNRLHEQDHIFSRP